MSCPLSEPWGQGHSLLLCLQPQGPRWAVTRLQGLVSAASPTDAGASVLASGPSASHAPGLLPWCGQHFLQEPCGSCPDSAPT